MARLAARISISSPLAGVSYVLPLAQVSYILVAARVDTDTRGLHRIVLDLVSLADQASLHTDKELGDPQEWLDALALQTAKRLTDSQSTADLAYLDVGKATRDRVPVSDASIRRVAKKISEQQALVDAVSSRVAKSLADNQPGFSDRQIRAVNKRMPVNYYTVDDFFQDNYVADAWADFASMQDRISLAFQYRRVYQDVSALVDQKNLYAAKLVKDGFAAMDAATLLSGKLARDSVTPTDRAVRSTSKSLEDVLPITDVFARQVNTARQFNENYVTDALAYHAVGKQAQDSVQALDALQRDLQTGKKDIFTPTEAKAVVLGKLLRSPNFNDFAYFLGDYVSRDYTNGAFPLTVFMDEVSSRLTGLGRTDPVTLLDSSVRSAGKGLADSLTATDSQSYQFSKTLQDAFGVNDTAVIGDGIAFTANKAVINVITPSDRYTSALTKALTDAATATDAGFLVSQGYSEMSYFAADYTGSRRSF